MIKVTSLVFAGLITASAAWAAAPQYSATLASPVAKETEYMIGSNLFRCADTTCVIVSAPHDATAIHTCRKLKQKVGDLTAYGASNAPYDAERLAKCNAK